MAGLVAHLCVYIDPFYVTTKISSSTRQPLYTMHRRHPLVAPGGSRLSATGCCWIRRRGGANAALVTPKRHSWRSAQAQGFVQGRSGMPIRGRFGVQYLDIRRLAEIWPISFMMLVVLSIPTDHVTVGLSAKPACG